MHKQPASRSIQAQHSEAYGKLPFDDTADFDLVERGFIATIKPNVIHDDKGAVIWDNDSYGDFSGDAPSTVHPSLWRQSRLVARAGLFEVTEGIYQVRGLDLSNVTFIEGGSGIIVIDPLLSKETAAAALALYRDHRGDRKVVAVIHTHSHVDHFGGVFGVTNQEEVDSGAVQIIAPEGFVEHAVSENVYAGTAMGRRAGYMYGAALERGPQGAVGAGLGQTTSTGDIGLIVPTLTISRTGETHTIDGIEIEFQLAPGTEAPSEMHFYFPQFKALCMAENATHNLHNLLTLRGALVRDPHVWAQYLTEAIDRYGDRTDVVFASHHWPTWDRETVVEYLSIQRDLYAYLHDQTLRLINRGYTAAEAAEEFVLPPALENAWHTRGYYGSVSHNVKAIVQRYLGWFDGNPARLWPHPPVELGKRYVEAIGGIDRVVEVARSAYDAGDFRWAATLLDHAVFSDENHADSRALLADTFEQLAYGSENGTWRNFYLSGATELRGANFGTPTKTNAPTVMAQLSPEQLLSAIAITVDGPRAWDLDLNFAIDFTDLGRRFLVTLNNGVLIYLETAGGDVQATLRIAKGRMLALLGGDADSPGVDIEGDPTVLKQLLAVLDKGDDAFAIVTP
ncbi:alkyl/aryl-sulfatase [Paeniglutamicibacter kerguelensis]|uniref:Alkyl sulfatase BDS1-like metallo-beta-lactamase superfamily hydrolase n=1 Tax=Paeniglutamicibacter kerguelensis TaxID=254788 RepID=A0ABS4XBB5_9MICC|nr:alkyl sulfatase dimerization domain-containing protein [Paeniglutamicibacter kerguelensis]MBP2385746.1 alkyl sulfatase BDS1-like metallo-beta-lactamase superfamily hydrolase [Paeniglutamicibacter kerguelensis]